MNFWWVNHSQTFAHEFRGGYLWSPKVRKDGRSHHYYDSMRHVCPGDAVFSYADGMVQGVGIAQSHCYTCPRPDEFGRVGEAWDRIGWRVDVRFTAYAARPKPKEHLPLIARFLDEAHSPLRTTGDGKQAVYLTQVSRAFARVLSGLISQEASMLVRGVVREAVSPLVEVELKGVGEWEEIEVRKIQSAISIPETERRALVKARIGQGRFKESVYAYEKQCRITRVANPVHLVASHIKPWRESSNDERLAAGNGLMLTPTIDHLFDRGFISFTDGGETLISPVADRDSLAKMGVNHEHPPLVGAFNTDQRFFLEHHRKSIFLS